MVDVAVINKEHHHKTPYNDKPTINMEPGTQSSQIPQAHFNHSINFIIQIQPMIRSFVHTFLLRERTSSNLCMLKMHQCKAKQSKAMQCNTMQYNTIQSPKYSNCIGDEHTH